jgi:hypothetical protein
MDLYRRVAEVALQILEDFQRPESASFPSTAVCIILPTSGNSGGNQYDTRPIPIHVLDQSLPENLAWMAASEFLLDAAIRFKLGRVPPSELLTNSNSVAKRPGR